MEKFFTANKVEYHHKPRSCVEPRLSVSADRISMGNPSQMKINPTQNSKNNINLDNIKAQQILNRLETDDNRHLLSSADKSILSDDFVCSQTICKQINQNQSGSVRETTVRTSKFKMKSPNTNTKSKPIYTTDRRNPKINKTIISKPQDPESKEFQTWTNFESNNKRDTREIKSNLVKESVKVEKSKPNKRSMNPDIKSLALLPQSYTEISSSSNEDERKEYRIERSTVHLRPGRLKRPG